MGYNEQQQKRAREVSDYITETAYLEKEVTERRESTFSQRDIKKSVSLGERFNDDAVKLGKKAWKPNKAEKEMNKKIDDAKALTPRATADTLELYNTCQARKAEKKRLHDHAPEKTEHMLSLLYSVDFNERMLTSSSVKANFSEYMNLIDMFDELNAMATITKDDEPAENDKLDVRTAKLLEKERKQELGRRLNPVSKQMDILKKRMEAYLGANGLKLDGSVLREDEKAVSFEYTVHTADAFEIHKESADTKKRRFDREALSKKVFDLKAIKEQLETPDDAKEYIPAGYVTVFSDLDSAERIRSIPKIRDCMRSDEVRLKSLESLAGEYAVKLDTLLKTKSADDKEVIELRKQVATYAEHIADAKRTLIEMKACLVLAEAEARYVLADEAHKEEMAGLAEKADLDYRRVLRRNIKLSMPLTVPKTVKSKTGITRDEATRTESDMKNYGFKYKLAQWARINTRKYPQLKEAILAYANVTHYSVGSEAESELLTKVLRLFKEKADLNDPDIVELKGYLDSITKTGSDIPDWNNIPAALRVDALDTDVDLSSLTKEEIAKMDKLPKETTAGKEKGSHRSSWLNGMFRVWTDLDKDTPLFAHEPTVNDLRQGKVSNCYMLAGTTGLVNYDPKLIKQCIKDNGDGTVTVRLYKESKRMGAPRVPVFVRVPKRVPKLAMGGEILSSGALWMQLIERACAQVGMFREGRSGYQSLWYGKGDEWLSILTGASGQSVFEDGIYTGPKFDASGKVIYTEKEVTDALTQEKKTVKEPVPGDIENLFETMTIAKSSKLIFHAGTKDNAAPGMNSGHAYTVLGTKTVNGKRFVTLRNPYANMSRVENEQGKVSKSTDFTSSVADETCGQFDMPYDEFLDTMQTISVSFMDKVFEKEMKDNQPLSLDQIVELETTSKTATDEVGEGDEDVAEMEALYDEAFELGLDVTLYKTDEELKAAITKAKETKQ